MSKKSRRRNKKILGALAAGLGAMALAKRKKASIADMDDAGIGVTHPALAAKDWITQKASNVADAATGPVLNVTGGIHANKPAKGMMIKSRPPKNIMHPIFGQHRVPPGGMRGMHKKGGRVTGAAKRGFGRALMKGKK